MASLGFREASHHCGLTSFGGNPLQTLRRSKQDGSGAVPGTAVKTGGVADFLWRATGCLNSFHLTAGDETDGAAIGRPERLRGTFGPGKTLRSDRADRADIKKPSDFRIAEVVLAGHKRERAPVGRNSEIRRIENTNAGNTLVS